MLCHLNSSALEEIQKNEEHVTSQIQHALEIFLLLCELELFFSAI